MDVLLPEQPLRGSISGGAKHRFEAHFPADLRGKVWQIRVEQRGIDLLLSATALDGSALGTVNSPLPRQQAEVLVFESETGLYEVVLEPVSKAAVAGEYTLVLEELPLASPRQRQRHDAAVALSEAGKLCHQGTATSREEAATRYRQALTLQRLQGDIPGQASTLHNLAFLHFQLGSIEEAATYFRQALELWQRLEDRAMEARASNGLGLTLLQRGEPEDAILLLKKAITLAAESGEQYDEAVARSNLCFHALRTGQWREARPCFERVLELHQQTGERVEEARTLINLAGAHSNLGEPQSAVDSLHAARRILQSIEDRVGEAQVLNNLAFFHQGFGEFQTAIELYGEAIAHWAALGNQLWWARSLNNLGILYWELGDSRRAQALLGQALELRQAAGDRRGEGITLLNLGRALDTLGDSAAALEHLESALEILRQIKDRQSEAQTLTLLGRVHGTLGSHAIAREHLADALALTEALGDRQGQARVLLERGQVQLASSHLPEARQSFQQALDGMNVLKLPRGQARALHGLARQAQATGQPEVALRHVGEATEVLESLRPRVESPNLRATFLGAEREVYALRVELLLSMGNPRAALEASEQARARSLLDLLVESEAQLYRHLDPSLAARRTTLQRRLAAKAKIETRVRSQDSTPEAVAAAEANVYQSVAQLEQVEAEIRRHRPALAALTRPENLSAVAMQALLDPDTLVLEYFLGDRGSALWAVDAQEIVSFSLPPRREIEALARAAYDQLATFRAGRGRALHQVAALSDLLLAPVADRLGERRLVVVADGALHYIPFAALPDPVSPQEPLLVRHEIAHLPSLATLATQRRLHARRSRPQGMVAAFGDPVFQAGDPRVRPSGRTLTAGFTVPPRQSRALERGAVPMVDLQRLPATRREVETITALAPASQRLVALDFAADREQFFGAALAEYRILHLATHGVLNTQHPELSGIVLSLVDDHGRPQSGFVALHEIFGLHLNADLVVLSGCQTALGVEVQGEGLIGLTHGFLYAGAERVAAGLWRVQDRATAALMSRFYQAMLQESMTPAAALRAAQLEIYGQRQWSHPYHWAAFVLQGDWR